MNPHLEREGRPLISRQECWRVVKEVESLVIALGTISGGLANTTIATLAAIISCLTIVLFLWELVTDGKLPINFNAQQPWLWLLSLIIVVISTIALVIVILLGREILRTRFFTETRASRSAVKELLANRRSILDRCLKECRKAVYSGDEGGLVLCSDAEKLLEALNKILGTGSLCSLRRLLRRLMAWLRRWVRAPS